MRFDLNNNTEPLDALPRFQRAKTRRPKLSLATSASKQVACALFILVILVHLFDKNSLWPALLCNNAAVLLLLAALLQSALRIDIWRATALADSAPTLADDEATSLTTARAADENSPLPTDKTAADKPTFFSTKIVSLLNQIGLNALWMIGLSALALVIVHFGWNLDLSAIESRQTHYAAAGLLILVAFGLLVVERHLANTANSEWPEALSIALVIRVVIAVQVLSLLALLWVDIGRVWPLRWLVLVGLLPALLAIEFILRALLAMFSPQRVTIEPPLIGESFIAAMFCWPPKPLQLLQDELQSHFNIDLRQVWAFGFMRRAFGPILMLMVILGWLLTSVSEIPLNQRAIYERFGRPVAVLQPGLHLGLPWPFGKMIAVENGVIHEIATASELNLPDDATGIAIPKQTIEIDTVEGPAPASANRLWDAAHLSEKSQVIASATNDKQSFQILNMDVRFIYRIGLTDQAALDATYHNIDMPTLIQSVANRVLVHDFSSRTLDEVLSGQTQHLTDDILQALQQNLDQMASGIELLAVVVEAIHPPAGAANAYHGVQAAQITSQVLIAKERANAADKISEAYINVAGVVDTAKATAHETIAAAQSDSVRFQAEKTAFADAKQAFLLEQYFEQLNQSLTKAPLLIIDHRLKASDLPTIDLRQFTAPLDSKMKSNTPVIGD
ncbi:protease modulator HflK [Utexia brackfieldae]|uniref:protease modulator HflK n=1 Tax=Utexia brackfieldae TaxID=3074108 RepID=UPI00370D351A